MDVEELSRLTERVNLETITNKAVEIDGPLWHAVGELNRFVRRETEGPADRDRVERMAAELKPFDAEPTLDAILEVARRHCYTVTFRFAGDD